MARKGNKRSNSTVNSTVVTRTRAKTTITHTVEKIVFKHTKASPDVKRAIYYKINKEIDDSIKIHGQIIRGLYATLATKYFYTGFLNRKNIQKNYERYSKSKNRRKFVI